MPAWIDAHNHLQDPRLKSAGPLVSTMRDVGISCCVVNATREEDWSAVLRLAEDHPDFALPALGIHPWHAHTATEGWQDRLAALLEKHPAASIGECGLDKWIDSPSIDIQMPVFLDQLRISRELDRPVTIHCLKAWDPLFEAFKNEASPRRFLMHSFGGSIETARRLIPLGAFFSFSGYFLQSRKTATIDVLRQLPQDRILVETDAPDMLPPDELISHPLAGSINHPANLPSIARTLAATLDFSPEDLSRVTGENFRRCFL